MYLQSEDGIVADGRTKWLVGDTKHHNDISVFRLRDELRDDADVVKRTLCIRDTHRAVEDVDLTEASGVVPTILRARKCVQVEVNAETILASPLDSLQKVTAVVVA